MNFKYLYFLFYIWNSFFRSIFCHSLACLKERTMNFKGEDEKKALRILFEPHMNVCNKFPWIIYRYKWIFMFSLYRYTYTLDTFAWCIRINLYMLSLFEEATACARELVNILEKKEILFRTTISHRRGFVCMVHAHRIYTYCIYNIRYYIHENSNQI